MSLTVGQLIYELEDHDPQAVVEIKGLGEIVDIEVNDVGDVLLLGEIQE